MPPVYPDTCKRDGCYNRRPPGKGYCSQQCWWEAEGEAAAERKIKAEKAEREHLAEREANPRTRLADILFAQHSTYEFERDMAMDDLIAVIKAET